MDRCEISEAASKSCWKCVQFCEVLGYLFFGRYVAVKEIAKKGFGDNEREAACDSAGTTSQ